NCVVLAGAKPQSEVRQRLAAGNVFVLPSVIDVQGGMDNLPTVIMEAMATRLPVVATNVGGIPEMVIENETGFLVPSGDAVALAAVSAVRGVFRGKFPKDRRNQHELRGILCRLPSAQFRELVGRPARVVRHQYFRPTGC